MRLITRSSGSFGTNRSTPRRATSARSEFKLGWLHDRQIGGLGALEDAIDVASRLAELVDEIRPIRNKSAARL